MPHYEVIYENGTSSIAEYENDEEALTATKAHHERAKAGKPAIESAPEVPASRVVKVLKYDKHPGTYGQEQIVSVDVAKMQLEEAIKATAKDGVVSPHEVYSHMVEQNYPLHKDPEAHGSKYKMQEETELSLPWSEG